MIDITTELRRVERKIGGVWVVIDFSDLKAGDHFRMFEPTGEQVIDPHDESIEFVALCDAYEKEEPIYEVGIEEPVRYTKLWTISVRGKNA